MNIHIKHDAVTDISTASGYVITNVNTPVSNMYDNGTIIVTMAACIIIVIINTASGIMYISYSVICRLQN